MKKLQCILIDVIMAGIFLTACGSRGEEETEWVSRPVTAYSSREESAEWESQPVTACGSRGEEEADQESQPEEQDELQAETQSDVQAEFQTGPQPELEGRAVAFVMPSLLVH